MELKRLPEWVRTAKSVSRLTGRGALFHLLDAFACYRRYGSDEVQYGEGGFYRLSRAERENTYTKQLTFKLAPLFNREENRYICRQKEEFNRFFPQYVKRPWLYCKEASAEDIQRFIAAQPRVIVKRTDSLQGQGIHELDLSKGLEAVSQALAGQKVLLERWIDQHPDLCLGTHSVNTIRVTTVRDRAGHVHMLKAVFRCGVGDAIVDNFTQGGVVYPLDMERGVIEGPGARKHSVAEGGITVHPGTDIQMVGRAMPFWPETLAMIQDAAQQLPDLRFIGWDIAITPEGPELVEGNTRPGPALLEYIGKKKGFYKEIMSYL